MAGEAGAGGFFGSGIVAGTKVQFLPFGGAQGQVYRCSCAVRGYLRRADVLTGQHAQTSRIVTGVGRAERVEAIVEELSLQRERPVTLKDQELHPVRQSIGRLAQAAGNSGTDMCEGASLIGQG